jgi:hypothetical protein
MKPSAAAPTTIAKVISGLIDDTSRRVNRPNPIGRMPLSARKVVGEILRLTPAETSL